MPALDGSPASWACIRKVTNPASSGSATDQPCKLLRKHGGALPVRLTKSTTTHEAEAKRILKRFRAHNNQSHASTRSTCHVDHLADHAEEPFLVVDQLMPQVVADHARFQDHDVSFRPWLAGTLSSEEPEEGPAGRRRLLRRPRASASSRIVRSVYGARYLPLFARFDHARSGVARRGDG